MTTDNMTKEEMLEAIKELEQENIRLSNALEKVEMEMQDIIYSVKACEKIFRDVL